MSFPLLVHIAFWCAVIPAILFFWNLLLYREPPASAAVLPRVSVLIPARNEEANIAAAVQSILTTRGVSFEVVVLDDGSTDHTAEIVRGFVLEDARVCCESGPSLPTGWAGKAHAAHVLSRLARYDILCFLDADVRLAPDALARMLTFMHRSGAALVSGFPQEETGTTLEWLLLPLIHFLLLSYLPIFGMRRFISPGFGAGCGQFLMMRRDAYENTGGYASIRTTMHDGIMMAKLFRKHGFHTDIADLTQLAQCRMYRTAGEVWYGLVKNATEGLAAPARILPFTALLLLGQVLPWVLLLAILVDPGLRTRALDRQLIVALVASALPRVFSVWRFRQRSIGAALHPVGVVVLLILQWYALARKLLGLKVTWKERAFDVG